MNLPPVYEDTFFKIEQSNECALPGYFILHLKEPYHSLIELSDEVATKLMLLIQETQKIVQQLVNPEKIYLCSFCELNPKLHYHIFPRTKELTAQYQKATQTSSIDALQLFAWAKEHYVEALDIHQQRAWHEKFKLAFAGRLT